MNQSSDTSLDAPVQEIEMGLFDHLSELRRRLLIIFAAVIVAATLTYFISAPLLDLLFEPFHDAFGDESLIGTGPAEAFLLKVKVAIFAGLLISSPIIFLQIWFFVAPGLYDHEKRMVVPFVFCTTVLFLLGVLFCYKVVFPFTFEFFKEQYATIEHVTPAIKVDEYLALVVRALLAFGLIFEMPILAFFLGRFGVIDHKTMIFGFRYAVVIIFIISAILTPPDVLTQFLMAIPLLLLYGISILIVKYTERPAPEESP